MSEFIALAARKISIKLAALLAPHKVALLAIEHQSAELMREKILAATEANRMKTAKIILKAAYGTSAKLAYQHAVKEFKLSGIVPPDEMPQLDQAYNEKLLKDLAVSFNDKTVTPENKAYRASLAASSAANRAYTEMQLAMYDGVNKDVELQKVWVANLTAGTPPCQYCMSLHNKVVALDKVFSIPKGLKPYQDLQGPPAHVNCRCRLVSRVVKK